MMTGNTKRKYRNSLFDDPNKLNIEISFQSEITCLTRTLCFSLKQCKKGQNSS